MSHQTSSLSFSQSLNILLDCGACLSRPVRFNLCLTNRSVTLSFGQKTSMTNASFHNFDSTSNGLRCDFSTNKLKSIQKAIRSIRAYHVILLPANFRQSFAYFSAILCEEWACSPKSRFFLLRRNFPPYTRESKGASSGFGRLSQNPAGAIIVRALKWNVLLLFFLLLFFIIFLFLFFIYFCLTDIY